MCWYVYVYVYLSEIMYAYVLYVVCVCVMHVYVSVVARYSDDIITLSACDALLLTLKKEIDVMTK